MFFCCQMRGNLLRRTIGGGVDNAANREEQIQRRDIRLTKIAITIVCVFVSCQLPRFLPNIVEIFTEKDKDLPQVFLGGRLDAVGVRVVCSSYSS